MAGFKGIYWCLLCLTSFVGLESAKIYMIDVPDVEPDLMFNKNYDDYDPLNNDYEYVFKRTNDHNIVLNKNAIENKHNKHINLCQRLFGSIYGHGKQQIRCLQSLKSHERSYFMQPKQIIEIQPEYRYNRLSARQKLLKPYRDLTKFSDDYLDVNDLAREGLDKDYVDVEILKSSDAKQDIEFDEFGDTTKAKCVPSRKWGLLQSTRNFEFNARVNPDSDSDSSESEEDVPVKMERKPKRYKVVTYDVDKSSESYESDENNKNPPKPYENSELEPEIDNISLDSGTDSFKDGDSSIEEPEATTKKRKSKKTGGIEEKYEYLQGNNFYNANDFRRRLSYFLPKRFHWDEDQYQRLGYYWFNGPKGKYIAAKAL